MTNRQTKQK